MEARIVVGGFELFIKARFKNDPALMHFVLNHERRHLAEQNVMREAKLCAQLPKLKFDKRKLEMLIAAGASIFCDLAKAAKEKQLMTSAELKRQESKAGELADTQAMVDEWAREAQSTAVTKSMAVPTNAKSSGAAEADKLGGGRGDGAANGPSGRDSALLGPNGLPVQKGS